MLKIEIPGREKLEIHSVIMDYNGTIAKDGILSPGAGQLIPELAKLVNVYVLTADTFGTVEEECRHLGITVKSFPREGAAKCKEEILQGLGKGTVAIGNGYNDILMFDAADLSIAIIGTEGAAGSLLSHADVIVTSPEAAINLLLKPDRLKATLRS